MHVSNHHPSPSLPLPPPPARFSGAAAAIKASVRVPGARRKLNLSGVCLHLSTMKALIFALAVITGCNARSVRQADTTLARFEDSVERFWQYISELNQKADGFVDNLKSSQLTRELDTLISDTMGELTTYRDEIQTKLAPYTASSTNQMSLDLQLLANKLQTDMNDAKERTNEYLRELQTMMQQNADDVKNRINTYTNKLRRRLNKDTTEIKDTVATYMTEIHSRTSQNLETVKGNVEPYVQQASDVANQKLRDISTRLETQAEALKTQLEASLKDLSTSMDGKLEEITELFAPYATKLREQFEDIMDKDERVTNVLDF
uniref:Apolipoprotein Eb n=1 Tax=Nothobranchius furzeri TaxID=105023 RepID=A0A8C6KCM0_NOTFU